MALLALIPFSAQAAVTGIQHTAPALLTPYAARAVVFTLIVGVLVVLLLGLGMLVISYGLMSKRPEDRIGERNPSDSAFLRNEIWPEQPYEEHTLPAEEEGEGEFHHPAA
ncbi:MAG: hypothetical protein ACXWPM_02785 [Bdellovibrionota bacterium]